MLIAEQENLIAEAQSARRRKGIPSLRFNEIPEFPLRPLRLCGSNAFRFTWLELDVRC